MEDNFSFSGLYYQADLNNARKKNIEQAKNQAQLKKQIDKVFSLPDGQKEKALSILVNNKEMLQSLCSDNLMYLFTKLRGHFDLMIQLYNNSSNKVFSDSLMVQEQLLVAYNKTNNPDKSIELGLSLVQSGRISGDVFGGLGKAYLMKSQNAQNKDADDVLRQGVEGISNIITNPGEVNTDFADVKNTMQGQGNAIMGVGVATGDNKAVEAATRAISNPMLENSHIDGAKNILINICASEEVSMSEVGEICKIVTASAAKDLNLCWGQVISPSMEDKISVTVIATGFDDRNSNYEKSIAEAESEVQDDFDPSVMNPNEFKNILNNNPPPKQDSLFASPDEHESLTSDNFVPDFNSFMEKNAVKSEEKKENEEGSLGKLFTSDGDDSIGLHQAQSRRPLTPPSGFNASPNDLSQPAIWSNPDFGRSINLSDD